VRMSSNPAFRNLPGRQGGGYAGFDDRYSGAGYPQTSPGLDRYEAAERPMTVDDVVIKTGITFGVGLAVGVVTALLTSANLQFALLALPAMLIGFGLALYIIFKNSSNPALVLAYTVAEGIVLGAITAGLEHGALTLGGKGGNYAGIGFQALAGTFGVFIGMLVVYKTGAVKVTPRLTKMVIGAMFGAVGLMLVNWMVSWFSPGGFGLRNGGGWAIVFSIVVIFIAAFSLLLDFDMADKAIRAGAPASYSWHIAFGLMVTMVWLYLEVLRLLSYLRQN
jgi:uncharacterized YccA/Bax inhibitor family protein